jgi:hypothetical protein
LNQPVAEIVQCGEPSLRKFHHVRSPATPAFVGPCERRQPLCEVRQVVMKPEVHSRQITRGEGSANTSTRRFQCGKRGVACPARCLRGLARAPAPLPIVAVRDPLARTCKTFRNRRPRSAFNGQAEGQPTPIFQGRLRRAVIDSGLSRRRPRVRVPSTPPTSTRKMIRREATTRCCGLSFLPFPSQPVRTRDFWLATGLATVKACHRACHLRDTAIGVFKVSRREARKSAPGLTDPEISVETLT